MSRVAYVAGRYQPYRLAAVQIDDLAPIVGIEGRPAADGKPGPPGRKFGDPRLAHRAGA